MAANATINIIGADKTQQAFASVQNKLASLNRTSAEAGRALTKNLDVKDVFRTLAVAIGLSAEAISNKIGRLITGTSEEGEKLSEKAESLQEKLAAIRQENALETMGEFRAVMLLRAEYEKLSATVAKGTTAGLGTPEYNKSLEDQIRLEEITKKLRDYKIKGEESLKKVTSEMGAEGHKRLVLEGQLATVMGAKVDDERSLNAAYAARDVYLRHINQLQGSDAAIIEQRAKATENYNEALSRIIVLETKRREIAMQAGEIIASGFEDAVLSGNKLSEVLRGLAQDLLRLVFRQSITAPLAGMIGQGLSSFFGGPRAAGGPVATGSSYMVGENGPELFVPSTAGRILNEHQMGGSGGGGGAGPALNFVYNIASGVTRAELKPILEQQRAQLRREIPDAVRRGGAYRSAFA